MSRLHLFEWEDQPWFPALIRDAGTAYLRFAVEISGQARALAGTVREVLGRSGTRSIVDLCSGGGGPVFSIVEALEDGGEPVEVTLTDLYPNVGALEALAAEVPAAQGRVRVYGEPVDARAVPGELRGVRTLFSALHHFRPEDARGILQSASRAREPLAAIEVVGRHPLVLLGILFAPIMTMLALPFLRPFRWGWLPLTYLVPVIPAFVLWDGLVSCLRCYSLDELRALADDASAPGYRWEVREIPIAGMPVSATALLGWPEAGEGSGSSSVRDR